MNVFEQLNSISIKNTYAHVKEYTPDIKGSSYRSKDADEKREEEIRKDIRAKEIAYQRKLTNKRNKRK